MPKSVPPLFLARRSYRRRRLMDAARVLPIAGAVIVMLPALWNPADTPAPDTAHGTVYLFASWAMLIGAAALLARRLAPTYDEDEAAEGATERGPAASEIAIEARDARDRTEG